MTDEAKYPEHGKMKAVQNRSQIIGEFLEWLEYEKGYALATYRPTWNDLSEDDVRALRDGAWLEGRFSCPTYGPFMDPPLSAILHEVVEGSGSGRHGPAFGGQPYRWVRVSDVQAAKACLEAAIRDMGYWGRHETLQRISIRPFPEALLAEFFDINLKKVSEEKEQMYAELRTAVKATEEET